jgi:hypothetical protein
MVVLRFHILFYINTTFIRRTSGKGLENVKRSNDFSYVGQHWIRRTFAFIPQRFLNKTCSIVWQINRPFDHSESKVALKLMYSVIKNTRIQDKITTWIEIINLWKNGTVTIGATLKNQNYIHEEIKIKLKSWNACFHPVHGLLSSSLLSKILRLIYTEL